MKISERNLRHLIKECLLEGVFDDAADLASGAIEKVSDAVDMGIDYIYKNYVLPEIKNKDSAGGLPLRYMLNYTLGKEKTIGAEFYSEKDISSLKAIIKEVIPRAEKVAKLKDSNPDKYKTYSKKFKSYLQDDGTLKIGIDYKTYAQKGGLDQSKLRSIEGMDNDYWSLANSLGAIWVIYDKEKNTASINDKYDFNKSEDGDFSFEDIAEIAYDEMPHAILEKLLRYARDAINVNEFTTKFTIKLD